MRQIDILAGCFAGGITLLLQLDSTIDFRTM